MGDPQDDYQIEVNRFGPGQAALQHALSRYNTGDTNRGIENGYLARVMTSLKRLNGGTAPAIEPRITSA